MAFSAVQTASDLRSNAASVTITMSSTGSRNLVVGGVALLGTTANDVITSVTDNASGGSNTYVVQTAVDHTTVVRTYQFYGVQVNSGATTITINFVGTTSYAFFYADEYSGFDAGATNTSVFDVSTVGDGLGTSVSVSTLTPSATGELIVATIGNDNVNTWTAGANFTLYGNSFLATPVGCGVCVSEYRLSGGATETAPATGSSNSWAERATAFKVGTPATTTNHFLSLLGVGS